MTSGSIEAPTRAGPTIAAGFARALLDFAVANGASRPVLLERSRIDPRDLADQNRRIALSSYRALMRAGKELCHDPALALHFGEAVSLHEMTIVAPICDASGTPADALARLNRLSRLLIDDGGRGPAERVRFTRDAAGVWLELTCDPSVDYPELTESSFARIAGEYARRFGGAPFARAVHFTHADPGYRAEYERIFGVPVVFGAGRNAMRIDESLLSMKLSPSNPFVLQVLNERAEELLEDLESARSARGQVERLLLPTLPSGNLRMHAIARKLGVSRQTLHRRLKAEGVSYHEVLDDLRRRLAIRCLRDNGVSVQETAARLGYSDPSAFSRAFKRWTGRRPSTPW